MKDNLLEEGDHLIVSNGHGSVPRVRVVERVGKAYAYAGEYRVHRQISEDWIREVAPDKWSRRSFRLANPETLIEARGASDVADVCQLVYALCERCKSKVGQAGKVSIQQLPALQALEKQLSFFLNDSAATPTKQEGNGQGI